MGLTALTAADGETGSPIAQPSMIMFGVADIAASVAFYRDKLGIKLANRNEEFAFFETGPVTLVLSALLGSGSKTRAGATELVFPVKSVEAGYTFLLRRGCSFLGLPKAVTGDSWAATLTDPDGHKITLFGPR